MGKVESYFNVAGLLRKVYRGITALKTLKGQAAQ